MVVLLGGDRRFFYELNVVTLKTLQKDICTIIFIL